MWEESTCLRFRENMQSRDAIRYVLERGDSCFTEYIGRNGGFQDIIIGSECAEVCLPFLEALFAIIFTFFLSISKHVFFLYIFIASKNSF